MATCTRSKFATSKTYSRKKYVYKSDTDEEPQRKKKPGSRINKSVMEEQSEYEKIRLKNIEEREKMLQSLEFGELFNEMNALMPPTVTQKQADDMDSGKSGQVRKKKNIWADIERLTMRLRSMDEKRKPDDGFVEKTEEKPLNIDERILDTQPMELEEEYFDNFLGDVKSQLKNTRKLDPNIDLSSCDLRSFKKSTQCFKMREKLLKVVPDRVQSLCVHPTTSKRLVIAGSSSGHIGLWDMDIPHVVSDIDKENVSVVEFRPHVAPTNCLSVSTSDDCKIYSTSHDGTMLCVNLEKMIFENMFATDFKSRVKHLTWHKEREADTFLITHGNGRVGIMDMRKRGASRVDWIKCFPRSARTVDIHPTNNNYFLVSSGTGSCCIFDMRNARQTNPVAVCQMNHPKGLTSAFFSGLGNYVLTTCNDDFLRVYDVKNLGNSRPEVISQTVHNNHTGKWLSVFKAIWYPSREDAFLIGGLKKPRRDLTYFTKKEVLHAHQRFKALAPEKVGHNKNAKLPMNKVLQFSELRVNPFGDRICRVFSSSHDGDCTFEDFLDMMSVFSDATPKSVKAEHAFRIFDFDGDDMLGVSDLREVIDRLTTGRLQQQQQRLSDAEMSHLIQTMLAEADLDDDGALSFAEFEHVIDKSPDFANVFRIKL